VKHRDVLHENGYLYLVLSHKFIGMNLNSRKLPKCGEQDVYHQIVGSV
jgi:hypothetical protein